MQIKKLIFVIVMIFGTHLYAQEPTYSNPLGIEFILINPGKMVVGKFQPTVNMGAASSGRVQATPAVQTNRTTPAAAARPATPGLPESDYILAQKLAEEDALPGFEVIIEKPYYIGKYQITQGQWKAVMGYNPSYFQGDKVDGDADQHPVESVSWKEVQKFIKKLNSMDKLHTYRLPTEFEWEYASRAGAEDDIPWANIRATAVIGTTTTNEVGSKEPNAWGLYDTLGNVWEWVEDFYNEKIFADPVPPKKGKEHVLKGAPFYGDVKNATYMTHAGGPGSKYDVGFRLVMEIK